MASEGPPLGSRTRKSRWRVSVVSMCNVDVDVGRLLEYGNILEKEGKSGKNRGILGYFCLFEKGCQKWCVAPLGARLLPPQCSNASFH